MITLMYDILMCVYKAYILFFSTIFLTTTDVQRLLKNLLILEFSGMDFRGVPTGINTG